MAMALHPEIQVKVQKELDSVIGRGRLPTFADRELLPYMECVFKESMRWGTPAPLCKDPPIVVLNQFMTPTPKLFPIV